MSRPGVILLKFINRFFSPPEHPFNLETGGSISYAEWQYRWGERTLDCYRGYADPAAIIRNHRVLDVGCGAGGKTCYYAELGAAHVWGIDISPDNLERAEAFVSEKNLTDHCTFVRADAADMPFSDEEFDVIIMNDTFEHLQRPGLTLEECRRVLRPGGRLYVNFPPYYHPYGAHLTDVIGIPWVHLFFSTRVLVEAYRELASGKPDAKRRLRLRLGDDARETDLVYINRMTIRKFHSILADAPFELLHYDEDPLRPFLWPLARTPILKECFVRMVTAVLARDT